MRQIILLMFALTICLGCGRSPEPARPETHPVHGQVFINDEPATGATIVLHPSDGKDFDAYGSRPKGKILEDGTFAVGTYESADGAPPGEYLVCLYWWEDADASEPHDLLGGRFIDPRHSQTRVQIHEGENQLEPIQLQGIRLSKRPTSRGSQSDSVDGL